MGIPGRQAAPRVQTGTLGAEQEVACPEEIEQGFLGRMIAGAGALSILPFPGLFPFPGFPSPGRASALSSSKDRATAAFRLCGYRGIPPAVPPCALPCPVRSRSDPRRHNVRLAPAGYDGPASGVDVLGRERQPKSQVGRKRVTPHARTPQRSPANAAPLRRSAGSSTPRTRAPSARRAGVQAPGKQQILAGLSSDPVARVRAPAN